MLSTVGKEGVKDTTKTAQRDVGVGPDKHRYWIEIGLVRHKSRAHLRKQRDGNGRYVTGLEARSVYTVYRKVVIVMERI